MAWRSISPNLCIVVLLLCVGLTKIAAVEVDKAPTKDWCKVTGGKNYYGINPAGECVNCELFPFSGVWQLQFGVCPTDASIGLFQRPYALVNSGEYKYCVCNTGYWGKPKGFPKVDISNFAENTFLDLGCYCCDPGVSFTLQGKVNATSPFQCNTCNPAKASGRAPTCSPKACPAGSNRGCVDCSCKCDFDPYRSDEGPPEPPCPVPATQQCKTGLVWDYRLKKCTCDFNTLRPDSGCKCEKDRYPVSAQRTYSAKPSEFNYCGSCNKDDGERLITEKGKKVCGCLPGFAPSILDRYFKGNARCQNCTVSDVTITKQGDCTCKPPLYPFIAVESDENVVANRADGYTLDGDVCRTCTAPAYKVDASGVCVCADGYALSGTNVQCVKCTGPGYKIETAGLDSAAPPGLPVCRCDVGYYPKKVGDTYVCTKCSSPLMTTPRTVDFVPYGIGNGNWCFCKDQLRDMSTNCGCKFGYQEDGKGNCVKKASCNNTFKASFWAAAQLPAGWTGGSFPDAVASKPPTTQVTIKLPFSPTSLNSWKAAGVPTSILTAKFAARFTGCACRPTTPPAKYGPDEEKVAEFYVKVENADVSVAALPPLKTPVFVGDYYAESKPGVNITSPVMSATGTTGSAHVGSLKAIYVRELCLDYDIKLWSDAARSTGPSLSLFLFTPADWGVF